MRALSPHLAGAVRSAAFNLGLCALWLLHVLHEAVGPSVHVGEHRHDSVRVGPPVRRTARPSTAGADELRVDSRVDPNVVALS
jgi:hypothetical protein